MEANNNLNMAQLGPMLLQAISDQNIAVYLIDLQEQKAIPVKGNDIYGENEQTIQQQLYLTAAKYSTMQTMHEVKEFNQLSTLPERLKEKRYVEKVFKGFDESWCVSKFIRLGTDEPIRYILHTVEKLDDQLVDLAAQKKQLNETKKLQTLVNAFMSDYDSVLNVDLKNRRVEFLRMADRIKQSLINAQVVPSLEELLQIYLENSVYADDQEKVLSFLTPENIMKDIPINKSKTLVYRNELGEYGEVRIIRNSKQYVLIGFAEKDLEIRERYNKEYIDQLTESKNRNYYIKEIANTHCSAVIMTDIDYFKKINDTYGHPFGDKVLALVARVLRGCIRKTDDIIRMGGDEFLVKFDNIPPEALSHILEKMRFTIASIKFPEHPELNLSMSFGAVYGDGIVDEMASDADKALYLSKQEKNTITISPYVKGKPFALTLAKKENKD